MRTLTVLLLLSIPFVVSAQQVDFEDDFSGYPDGSDMFPKWSNPSFVWEVQDGALTFAGPFSTAWPQGHPRYGRFVAEVTVTLEEGATNGWEVAALGAYSDDENLWHLALVEGPDDIENRHFVELTECYKGAWPSHEHAELITGKGTSFDWQYNVPYRMILELTSEGIAGRITDPEGAEMVNISYRFTGPAVKAGRICLRGSGFKGRFDDFKFTAGDPLPEPEPEDRAFPEYDVAASDLFTEEATGFFHTTQRDGRWWVVDPKGRAFYAVGTDHCRYSGHWCQELGYAPYGRNNDAKWDSREEWAIRATDRLRSWGFNLLGAGNGSECKYRGLAHTGFISFGTMFSDYDDICPKTTWTGFPNVFNPRWPSYCEKLAAKLSEDINDPWLFGYFLDNELEWYGKSYTEWGLFDEAMKKGPEHTAKLALVDMLKGKYENIADLNAAWGADLASFEAILALEELGGRNTDTVREDKIAYTRLVAEEYFKHTTAAIRKADPNHMVIGCRFAGNAPAGIWDICGKYCDIVTFNYYGRVDLEAGTAPGHVEQFTEYYEQAQKPLMITEWSFPALDSGLPCQHGAGMRVDTQAQKAECFRVYQEMFFRLPFFVGSDYFMWVDEPAQGISDTFPEDSNYGLVSEDDEPYEELTQMATRVNATAYTLHDGNYPDLGIRDGRVVYNAGKAAATFTLRLRKDGAVEDRKTTLAPGEEKQIEVAWEPAPGAHLLAIEVDPERTTADADRANNLLVERFRTGKVTVPTSLRSCIVRILTVSNEGAEAVEDAIVIARGLPAKMLATGTDARPRVYSADGKTVLPSQVCGDALAVQVGDMEPWSAGTYLVAWNASYTGQAAVADVNTSLEGGVRTISNGALTLAGPADGGGNVFNRVALDGVQLGTYNPLVWQEAGGQNQWVKTSRAKLTVDVGPVWAFTTAVARGGAEAAITAVDEDGRQEPSRTDPVGFEVSHLLAMPAGTNWFLTRLDYIKNISDRPFTLKGYFFYLNGEIGGSAEGDQPAGPNVPNYYSLAGAAWQDDGAGLVYGVVPLGDKIYANFWLDGGGGQHPDARRQLDDPLLLGPGEVYRDGDAPWVLVYGAKAGDDPWRDMGKLADGLQAMNVTVETPEGWTD